MRIQVLPLSASCDCPGAFPELLLQLTHKQNSIARATQCGMHHRMTVRIGDAAGLEQFEIAGDDLQRGIEVVQQLPLVAP